MNKTKNYFIGGVLCLIFTLVLGVSISVGADGVAENGRSADSVLLLVQAESCVDRCEADKKSCMEKYTRTNINGVKFVTPEGVKLCSVAYRECKSYCK